MVMLAALMLTGASIGESISLLDRLPVFTVDYGLNDWYEEVKAEQGGPFRDWSVAKKARLSEMSVELRELERARVAAMDPSWYADCNALACVCAQRYGVPDVETIPEAEAVVLAHAWLAGRLPEGRAVTDYQTAVSYVIDGPSPEWVVTLYEHGMRVAEAHMNAHTGAFPQMERMAAEQLVLAYAEDHNAPGAFALTELISGASYDDETHTWTFFFTNAATDVGLTYFVDDTTGEVMPGPCG